MVRNPMYVYISATDREWRPGEIMAAEENLEFYLGHFAHYMADIMAEELQKAIDTQRFKFSENWKPLSIPYYEYKKRKNLSLKIWEATGLLKDNIKAYRSGSLGAWVVGVDRYKRYPDTNVRIFQVAKFMEFGTIKMPARPLFRPLSRYLRKNIRPYWEKFKEERGLD